MFVYLNNCVHTFIPKSHGVYVYTQDVDIDMFEDFIKAQSSNPVVPL